MKFKTNLRAVVALSVACGAGADELKPLEYSATTNIIRYERTTRTIPAPDTNFILSYKIQTTNCPAAIIHAVTWGRGTNAVFVLKTCEVLKVPDETNGWRNAEWRYYHAATWVESVK